MANKNLPIKIFAKRKKTDERRTEGSSRNELPPWANLSEKELIERAENIIEVLNITAKKLDERSSSRDFIPATVKVELNENAIAKSHRADIANLFNYGPDYNIIGVVDDRSIVIKVNSLNNIEAVIKRLQKPRKYIKSIASIAEIEAYEPNVIIDNKGKDEALKASLINYHNFELNKAIAKEFERTCEKIKANYIKTNYSSELIIYRLSDVSLDGLDVIKNFEALETLTIMPKYSITLDDIVSHAKLNIPIKYPKEGHGYPIVGVLDSGIKDIAHLKPWIVDSKFTKIPEDRMNQTHGTFVSGVLLYGDELQEKTLIDGIDTFLFDATVIPDLSKDSIEEWVLVEHIREAVEKHKEIKIWNLSLGTTAEIANNDFSEFGKALDDIQEKHNVLICKSAGNCMNFLSGKPIGKLSKSADSVRSLVIASIAHEQRENDLSEKDHPSPFSRTGKGPANIYKPELTHYGGNAGKDSKGNLIISGVKSFITDGTVAEKSGTSFSTPRITSLLATLNHRINEDYSPLLLKALAIHSATYPDSLTIPHSEKIKRMGFGIPKNIGEILYNDPHEITLILQDTLVKGEYIEISDFPYPQSMVENGKYYGHIILTVVSSPILCGSQGAEYCQSNIDISLGTYDKLKARDGKTIINKVGLDNSINVLRESNYSSSYKEDHVGLFARERALINYGDKYQPIKKYAVNLEEMTPANKEKALSFPKKWFLKIEGVYRDFAIQRAMLDGEEVKQEFCLMVTIRDNKKEHEVYNEATRLLDVNGFYHNSINIRTEIPISVSR